VASDHQLALKHTTFPNLSATTRIVISIFYVKDNFSQLKTICQ